MLEIVIVETFSCNQKVGQYEFKNYDLAFSKVKVLVDIGYTCIIKRLVNGKEWVKLKFEPSETM